MNFHYATISLIVRDISQFTLSKSLENYRLSPIRLRFGRHFAAQRYFAISVQQGYPQRAVRSGFALHRGLCYLADLQSGLDDQVVCLTVIGPGSELEKLDEEINQRHANGQISIRMRSATGGVILML